MCIFADEVIIKMEITQNITPPKQVKPYTVTIQNKKITKQIKANDSVPEGVYQIKIDQPGYEPTVLKKQTITGKIFTIKSTLIAKKRSISAMIVYTRGCGDAHKIIDMKKQKEIRYQDLYTPGQEVHFRVLYKGYKTVDFKGVIPVGEGCYDLPINKYRLKSLEFTARYNSCVIDGIHYEYQFFVDSKKVENHLMKSEKGIGRFYYTIMVDPKAKIFNAYFGYFFSKKDLQNFRPGMSIIPRELSIIRLVTHLKQVRKKTNKVEAVINAIKFFLEKDQQIKSLRNCSNEQIKTLFDYLDSLNFNEVKDLKQQILKLVKY